MFITKKHLSRRTLLRGGTAAIGLPLLSAMVPAATALAQTAAAPKPRMGFFYLPHGAIMNNTRFGAEMNRWTPDKVGRDFDLKPILEPFKPLQKYLTVVSGLGNKPAESSAVHAIVPATWLSAEHPRQSHAPFGGVTIDQIAARHIGQETPLPSLELATEEEGGGAACDGTYGCSYGRTISFRTPTTPMPMEHEPRKAFEKIFGRGKSEAERRAVSGDYKSLLDMALAEANALEAHARRRGPRARRRLSRQRPGDRAPARALGPTRPHEDRLAGRAGRSAELRRSHSLAVRPDRRGVPSQHDAHYELHDGGRSQQSAVRARRRARCVPSGLASRRQQSVDGEARADPALSHAGVRRLHDEAREDPRRRAARSSTTRSSCTAAT